MKKERMARMVIEIRDRRMWLDVTDLFQFAKGVGEFEKEDLPEPVTRNYEEAEKLYDEAVSITRAEKRASTSLLQRKLKIGYLLSSDLMELMEQRGVIGPKDGPRPRKVLPQTGL